MLEDVCVLHKKPNPERVKQVKQAAGKFDPNVTWQNFSSICFEHE